METVASYKQDRLIFFSYDLVTVNDCLSATLENAKSDTNPSLQTIRKENLNKLIFAHLNNNLMNNNILMISESKVDDSFLHEQFFLDGFAKPFRLDRNRNGGGFMIFI